MKKPPGLGGFLVMASLRLLRSSPAGTVRVRRQSYRPLWLQSLE